jgi:hypothetical protein
MKHEDFYDYLQAIPEEFDDSYDSNNSLFLAYSHIWISFENALEYGDDTESVATYLILAQHLLNRTDVIHYIKKDNATRAALRVLNERDRLELEPEDNELRPIMMIVEHEVESANEVLRISHRTELVEIAKINWRSRSTTVHRR